MPFTTSVTQSYSSISSSIPSGSATVMTTGVVFPADAGRKAAYLQVIGSGGPLYVSYGPGPAGTGNFNVLLKPATVSAAFPFGADGGVLVETNWQGPISVSGAPLCQFLAWAAT